MRKFKALFCCWILMTIHASAGRTIPNGTTDNISFNGNGTALSFTTPFTIAAWVNPSSCSVTGNFGQAIIDKGPTTGMFLIACDYSDFNQTGSWIGGVHDNTGQFLHCSSSGGGGLVAGTWQHIAITYDGPNSIIRNYYNGVQCASGGNNTTSEASNTNNVIIGGRNVSYSVSYAHVAVWSQVLNPAQVLALAHGEAPPCVLGGSALRGYWPLYGTSSPEADNSGQHLPGTVTGTTVVAAPVVVQCPK